MVNVKFVFGGTFVILFCEYVHVFYVLLLSVVICSILFYCAFMILCCFVGVIND